MLRSRQYLLKLIQRREREKGQRQWREYKFRVPKKHNTNPKPKTSICSYHFTKPTQKFKVIQKLREHLKSKPKYQQKRKRKNHDINSSLSLANSLQNSFFSEINSDNRERRQRIRKVIPGFDVEVAKSIAVLLLHPIFLSFSHQHHHRLRKLGFPFPLFHFQSVSRKRKIKTFPEIR